MSSENEKFITHLINKLPDVAEIDPCPNHFWELMEVNAERVRQQMKTHSYVEERLNVLGPIGAHLLATWIGLDISQTDSPQEATHVVAEHFSSQADMVTYQTILFLSEFLYRRQPLPVETISQALLEANTFQHIFESEVDDWSKRFCYTLLVFIQNNDNLRLLLLFENGERVGYSRCTLTPVTERRGQPLSDEAVQQVEAKIKSGANLQEITPERVDTVLEAFESRSDGRHSRCFDVIDEVDGTKLVFILREWREAIVRQVNDVVFANEAELIVLRFKDKGIRLEEHGNSTASRPIAAAILGDLLGEKDVHYLKDTQSTPRKNLDALLKKHLMADVDEQLRFQELYLIDSAVEQSPRLILRCGKKETLTKPILDLQERGINLLANLNDIRHIKIAFVLHNGTKFEKSYIFKIFFRPERSGDFFLPYSVANVPTRIRADFEAYLREKYHVRIIPGTK